MFLSLICLQIICFSFVLSLLLAPVRLRCFFCWFLTGVVLVISHVSLSCWSPFLSCSLLTEVSASYTCKSWCSGRINHSRLCRFRWERRTGPSADRRVRASGWGAARGWRFTRWPSLQVCARLDGATAPISAAFRIRLPALACPPVH